MSSIILVLALCCTAIVSYYLMGRRLSAPAIWFVLPFIAAILVVYIFQLRQLFQFNLSATTIILVLSGAVVFVAISSITYILSTQFRPNDPIEITILRIPSYVPMIILVAQILTSVLIYHFEVQIASEHSAFLSYRGWGTSFIDIIGGVNYLSHVDVDPFTGTKIDGYPQPINSLLFSLGVVSIFLWVRAYLTRQLTWVLNANVITAFVASFIAGGARTTSFGYIFYAFIYIFLLHEKTLTERKYIKISPSSIIKGIVFFAVGVLCFWASARLIGRRLDEFNFFYYIGIYTSAPLKNLDLALSGLLPSPAYWGQYTFQYLWVSLALTFHLVGTDALVLNPHPFVYLEGKSLGNVYTVYRALVIDFGYIGALLMLGLTAIVMTLLYRIVMTKNENNRISSLSIIYITMLFDLFMSFFSENIFQNTVSTKFVYNTIFIMLLCALVNRALAKRTKNTYNSII